MSNGKPKKIAAAVPDDSPTQDEVYGAVSNAYDEIQDLYDASEGQDSVQLFQTLMELSKLRTALNQSHLESRTGEYDAIKKSLSDIIGELNDAKQRVNNIIKVASTAVQVAGAIDKAINLASKYFGV
jgi:transcriptional regulator with PAS, ATPase and Fis domain